MIIMLLSSYHKDFQSEKNKNNFEIVIYSSTMQSIFAMADGDSLNQDYRLLPDTMMFCNCFDGI